MSDLHKDSEKAVQSAERVCDVRAIENPNQILGSLSMKIALIVREVRNSCNDAALIREIEGIAFQP